MRECSLSDATVTLSTVAERLQGVDKTVQELQRGQEESLRLLALLLSKIEDATLAVVTEQDEESTQQCALGLDEDLQCRDVRSSRRSFMKTDARSTSWRLDVSGAPLMRDVGVKRVMEHYARRIVDWRRFDYLVGLVILANAVVTGVETQLELEGHVPLPLRVLEHFFLVMYTLELGLRLLARGWGACFRDGWYLFDLSIVVVGVVSLWVVGLVTLVFRSETGAHLLTQFLVIRVARLLRLLRAVRMVQQFHAIWRLVYGLITSVNIMISTLTLVGLVLYIFACLGIELITMDSRLSADPNIAANVDLNFGSLPRTMLFLIQFVTLDGVAEVYRPLIRAKPVLIVYFVALILVVSVSLMNMVMAKIVEAALDAAKADREVERQQKKDKVRSLVPKLHSLFESMDSDSNGKVTLKELEKVLLSDEVSAELKAVLKIEGAQELFAILDIDNSGEVSQHEFVEGILNMHMAEIPLHQVEILQLARHLQRKVNRLDRVCVWLLTERLAVRREGEVLLL